MSLTPYIHLDPGVLADAAAGALLPLPDAARSHLERVLRMKAGARLVVADGEGREAAAIMGVGTVVVDGPVVSHAPETIDLHLVQGLAKGRKTDQIVRSATELGVDRVTIIASQRSVTKPAEGKGDKMAARWREVARAAAEQARRPRLPQVNGPVTVKQFVEANMVGAVGVIGDPTTNSRLRQALATIEIVGHDQFVVAVGPEGGWDEAEVARLSEAGLVPASLGETVLRTEHAGHALCAVVSFYLGRMG